MSFPQIGEIVVAPLSEHRQHLPLLQAWFEAEWPAYYGPGGPGDAEADLRAYADAEDLPLGLIALLDGRPCGLAALKDQTFASHQHLGPWVGAGYVRPELRGRGIGARLLASSEALARSRGFSEIYCGTSSAWSLLERGGWLLLETIDHDGERLGVYRKAL